MRAKTVFLAVAACCLGAASASAGMWMFNGFDKLTHTHNDVEWVLRVSANGKSLTVTGVHRWPQPRLERPLAGAVPGEEKLTLPSADLPLADVVTDGYTVTAIGRFAFPFGQQLGNVTLGNGLTSIAEFAFSGCACLTELELPASLTDIGQHAFFGCSGLTEMTIPASVTNIGIGAFDGCSGLTSMTIPDTAANIGGGVFSGCASLTNISVSATHPTCRSIGGILFDKAAETLDTYPAGRAGTYAIPDGVTRIGNAAFKCCALTEVTIPDSVTRIGWGAFDVCTNLTEITIPVGVANISPRYMFGRCDRLAKITVADANTAYRSIGGVLFDNDVTQLFRYPPARQATVYAIPGGVTSIDDAAFGDCVGLTEITIPDSVTHVQTSAFHGCTGLTKVTFPDSVTSLGSYLFLNCTNLTEVAFGNGITRIPTGMFRFGNCARLKTVVIPDSVTHIDSEAFKSCAGLTDVTIPASVTSLGEGAFVCCAGLTSVTFNGKCPDGVMKLYRDASFEGTAPTLSVTSYIRREHAASWASQLDSGSLEDGTAIWQERPIKMLRGDAFGKP